MLWNWEFRGWSGCSKTGTIHYTSRFVFVSVLTIAQLCEVLMPYVWKTYLTCYNLFFLACTWTNVHKHIVVNMKPELKWFVNMAFEELIQGYVRCPWMLFPNTMLDPWKSNLRAYHSRPQLLEGMVRNSVEIATLWRFHVPPPRRNKHALWHHTWAPHWGGCFRIARQSGQISSVSLGLHSTTRNNILPSSISPNLVALSVCSLEEHYRSRNLNPLKILPLTKSGYVLLSILWFLRPPQRCRQPCRLIRLNHRLALLLS